MTAVIYYSLTGKSADYAREIAEAEHANLITLRDARTTGKLKAYTKGCVYAMRGKAWATQPLSAEATAALDAAERLVVVSPIWAGNVPPAVNDFLAQMPQGKSVEFKLLSGGGNSGCAQRLQAAVSARGGVCGAIEDIKAGI